MIEIKHSTRDDFEAFFDKKAFPLSTRSWSILKDDVLACVFGYMVRREGCVVFCDIKEGYGKVEIAKTARKAIKVLAANRPNLVALQDKEICSSERFLNFLGFYRSGNSDVFEYGGVQ